MAVLFGLATGAVAFGLGVLLADKVKAAVSAFVAKLKVKAEAQVAAEIQKVKEKI